MLVEPILVTSARTEPTRHPSTAMPIDPTLLRTLLEDRTTAASSIATLVTSGSLTAVDVEPLIASLWYDRDPSRRNIIEVRPHFFSAHPVGRGVTASDASGSR